MIKEKIKKASEIIFANEGGYSSVNADDNGAVSVGRIQWHGTRALRLLKKIVKALGEGASEYLSEALLKEINAASSWDRRTVNTLERAQLSALLSTEESKSIQDKQADDDVGAYLKHVEALGVTDENAQIFMADIENQGGAKASERIINAAEGKDIDSLYVAASMDAVFRNYMPRRGRVYQILTGHAYGEEPYDGEVYPVAHGDTLSKIAREHNTTVAALVELNGIKDPDHICVGDVLKIPTEATEESKPADTEHEDNTYTSVEGDTLSKIARDHNTTVAALCELNDIHVCVGEVLKLPVKDVTPEAPVATVVHKVEPRDTLTAISARYGVSIAAILSANRDLYRAISANYIVAGWELIIPRGETDA